MLEWPTRGSWERVAWEMLLGAAEAGCDSMGGSEEGRMLL